MNTPYNGSNNLKLRGGIIMLYGNKIYRKYLELLKRKERSKNEFEHITFMLCDFPGGNGELSTFIEKGGLYGYENCSMDVLWYRVLDSYKILGYDNIIIRCSDASRLRKLIFDLDKWAKNDGWEGFEDVFYIEEVEEKLKY